MQIRLRLTRYSVLLFLFSEAPIGVKGSSVPLKRRHRQTS